MNTRVFCIFVFCVVTVCAVENPSVNVRGKRTLHIVLKAFADSLGYDIQKRPPLPPNGLPKPAGDRSPVNPPLVPPMMPPPKGPVPPMPAPRAPPMAAPKAPVAPMPAPKSPPVPMVPSSKAPAPALPPQVPPKTAPRLPTVPPTLTETIQKMFNVNFNWNRNAQTPPPSAIAPKAPATPTNQAPAPIAPKAPIAPAPKAPAPAPKAPMPAPKAPMPAPKSPAAVPSQAPAPAAPASTAGPIKHVLYSYDYDDGQIANPQNLKDYDNYYQYDNQDYQRPLQQPPQQEEPQQQQAEEEGKQSEEVPANQESDNQQLEVEREKQKQVYDNAVQNYWQNSPWHNNQQENVEEESRMPHFGSKDFGGHSFVVNHPAGSSYSRMERKQAGPLDNQPKQQSSFETPIYYYEEQQQPPLETRNQKLEHQQNYHFQGPSFDQYFYVLNNGEQNGGKANVEINSSGERGYVLNNGEQNEKANLEINSSGERGIKQPAESRQRDTITPEANFPVPVHNIYQENPYLQWISPFEASSEVQEKKVKATQQAQPKQDAARGKVTEAPLFATNYQPDHYNSDFSVHTIPPSSQEDYSKYEPAPLKLENEFSDKAQVNEQQFGRKYTSVHTDNLVHHTEG